MNEQGARQLTGRRRELLNILPALRRFALSLTGSAAAADEFLHDTVARVLQQGLPLEAELLPWCIRACRHIHSEEVRARNFEANRGAAQGAAAGEPVQAALAELPDDQRAVLELIAVEGHSYREAAAMLDVPIGTVMNRLARARGALIERCRPLWQAAPERKAANHD